MQNNSLVSVIIPIYNAELYLSRCIESIRRQSYINLEIILVDDGSTDQSGSICDNYIGHDSRITVIHKKNSGPFDTRVAGIQKANGAYLMFVDSDDSLPEDSISNLHRFLTDFDLDIAIGYTTERTSKKQFKSVNSVGNGIYDNITYIKTLLMGESGIAMHSKLIKKSLFDNSSFIISQYIRHNEDLYMNLLFGARAKKIGINNSINGYIYYYQNNYSLSRSFSMTKEECYTLFMLIYKFLKERNYYNACKNEFSFYFYNTLYYQLILKDTDFAQYYKLKNEFEIHPVGKEKFIEKLNENKSFRASYLMVIRIWNTIISILRKIKHKIVN